MADSGPQLDVELVGDLPSTVRRLLADLGAADRVVTDPVVIATEAAVGALYGIAGSGPIGEVTLRLMPANATPFERGLAVGMALILGLPALPWNT